jgi:hypothetical protein
MKKSKANKTEDWLERLVKDYKLPIQEETEKPKRILSDKQLQIVKSKE